MVKSQIDTLTPGFSFGHNLYCKYSNGSCEPILNIFVLRTFQWCKELFNLISYDLSNRSQKIWKSIRFPTPKMRPHLGVCGLIPSHSLALLGVWMWVLGCIFGPQLSMPLALVTSPKLGSWQCYFGKKDFCKLLK
jgi:hypothetical protein